MAKMTNKVNDTHNNRSNRVFKLVFHQWILASKPKEACQTYYTSHQKFPNQQNEASNSTDRRNTGHVSCKQKDGIFGTVAEVFAVYGNHDVGVLVDETQTFLKTPETTFQTYHDEVGHRVVSFLFQFLMDVFQRQPGKEIVLRKNFSCFIVLGIELFSHRALSLIQFHDNQKLNKQLSDKLRLSSRIEM